MTGMNVNLTGMLMPTTGNTISSFSGAGTITGITTGAGNDIYFPTLLNSFI